MESKNALEAVTLEVKCDWKPCQRFDLQLEICASCVCTFTYFNRGLGTESKECKYSVVLFRQEEVFIVLSGERRMLGFE